MRIYVDWDKREIYTEKTIDDIVLEAVDTGGPNIDEIQLEDYLDDNYTSNEIFQKIKNAKDLVAIRLILQDIEDGFEDYKFDIVKNQILDELEEYNFNEE